MAHSPTTYRILVCGGRTFSDAPLLYKTLDHYRDLTHNPICLIHGGATGADTLAGQWAAARNIPCNVYPADWATHGRAAGFMRNQQMLDEAKPHLVLAFEGGRGTEDMVRRAVKAGIPTVRCENLLTPAPISATLPSGGTE